MRKLLWWAVAVVVVGVAALLVISHVYHPFTSPPSLVHACGHDYEPAGATTDRAHIEASGVTPFNEITTTSGNLLSSYQIWGEVTPSLGAIPAPQSCGPTVWLRTGTDRFKPYTLVDR